MRERQAPAVSDRARKEARDWIVRLSSGAVSEAELAQFKAWQAASDHARAFAEERRFWGQLGRLETSRTSAATETAAKPRLVGRRAVLAGGGALAASIAGVMVAPRIKLLWEADYRTAVGEQRRVALPDGAVATLNTDSAIALDYRPDLRLVHLLRGEAFFEVRPQGGRGLRVAALGGVTRMTEAACAVRLADAEAVVTVASGQVEVFCPASPAAAALGEASPVALGADQMTRYAQGHPPASATAVDMQAVLAWRSGRIVFEGRPLARALVELERYVPERIILADQSRAGELVSGVFSIRQAQAAIEALAQTQNLTARRIPGVMIVIS
ncbi:MAG: hypothetical protein BGN91_04790 [Nitrobacter sp. 62-13]|jgi:transmembrane sensor|uniref:FecR family protein n=1 Tax=Nitrobacter sp. 62-13 TaxID=1895797 RepID=UPI00095F0C76|nr:FecR domain-containing protein [Nitrobacter sp. 62-13]OJU29387.1 MAG: hypothetical protein BGN91_04790 [Nitrobacter sp. 62-13]